VAASQLRRILEKGAGWEEFHYVIPHCFLPPRYRDISKNRNMRLLLDRDLTLHVRWEGSRTHEHHPLTPGAVNRLLGEVSTNMAKYRKELQVFSRFVRSRGEAPFEDLRYELADKEVVPPVAKKAGEGIIEVGANAPITRPFFLRDFISDCQGGESPMGGGFDE
jgi:hypothetical protein